MTYIVILGALVLVILAYILHFNWKLNQDADVPGMEEMAKFFLDRDGKNTKRFSVVVIDYDPGVYFACVAGKRQCEIKGFAALDEAAQFAKQSSMDSDEGKFSFLFDEDRKYISCFHQGKEVDRRKSTSVQPH